jgi:hypothetical protein
MKTLRNTATIAATFVLMVIFTLTAASANFTFPEEGYIDDIPFDTELITHNLMLPAVDFEEEAFVNDIPFNTACISADCRYEKAMAVEFGLEEETYIDDLPVNTAQVAENHQLNKTMMVEFEMEEESYIDDIPFNTSRVAAQSVLCNNDNSYASGK